MRKTIEPTIFYSGTPAAVHQPLERRRLAEPSADIVGVLAGAGAVS